MKKIAVAIIINIVILRVISKYIIDLVYLTTISKA